MRHFKASMSALFVSLVLGGPALAAAAASSPTPQEQQKQQKRDEEREARREAAQAERASNPNTPIREEKNAGLAIHMPKSKGESSSSSWLYGNRGDRDWPF